MVDVTFRNAVMASLNLLRAKVLSPSRGQRSRRISIKFQFPKHVIVDSVTLTFFFLML